MISQKLVQQDLSRKGRVSFANDYIEAEVLPKAKDLYKRIDTCYGIISTIQQFKIPTNIPVGKHIQEARNAISEADSELEKAIKSIENYVQRKSALEDGSAIEEIKKAADEYMKWLESIFFSSEADEVNKFRSVQDQFPNDVSYSIEEILDALDKLRAAIKSGFGGMRWKMSIPKKRWKGHRFAAGEKDAFWAENKQKLVNALTKLKTKEKNTRPPASIREFAKYLNAFPDKKWSQRAKEIDRALQLFDIVLEKHALKLIRKK